jgi:hypothetical protein
MELSQDLPTLKRLWKAAEHAASLKKAGNAPIAFETIGLTLDWRLINGGYYCTPTNSSVFAWGDIDGFHFSFLHFGDNLT